LIFEPAGEAAESESDCRPDPVALFVGVITVGVISAMSLPWPVAIASSVLGALMIAGADIDARTFLLPDLITGGAVGCGVVAAALLDSADALISAGEAIVRAIGIAAVLAIFRDGYARIRRNEGLGLGDVKLAAAIGAWLPVEAIPLCFGLATTGALLTVTFARFNGRPVAHETRIPFGAFLCPALWIVFYVDQVTR
jgi:leader peptidase (prepilin peptidase) / N-methyltransferase